MEEKKLSVSEEVAAKEKVWDARFDFDTLIREATRALARQTESLAVAATTSGNLYHSGYANLLGIPEFYDIDVTKTILAMIDEHQAVFDLFRRSHGDQSVHMLLGDELGYDYLEPCGMIFTHFDAGPKKSGSIGIIGSSRWPYSRMIPMVRYFGDLIEELAKGI
jgi:heat-inducible transcriptional repressor